MNTKTKTFKVAPGHIVWSQKFQKHFREGELLDLSHASDEDIALVEATGAIVPAGQDPASSKEEVKKEANNG